MLTDRKCLTGPESGFILQRELQRVVMRTTQKSTYYLAGCVAVVAFAVYLPSLQNDFIAEWDDGEYVLNNPFIRSIGLAFLKWSFFDFYASNWHPLTWISHALDYALWGLNPLGHHLTSVILHAVNTFLVVVLVMRLQEAAKGAAPVGGEASAPGDRGMLITAGVTGLLFGLHPVHVESVAWIAERKDLLCALFFLLSIAGYRNYVAAVGSEAAGRSIFSRFSTKGYLLSLGFFILALLSKPMAVSLPVVLLILDWYPFRRLHSISTVRAALVEKLPFVAFSLISSVLTILAQRAWGAVVEIQAVPLSSRLLVAVRSLVAYLGKMIVPVELVPYYPYPKVISILSMEFLLAFALAIGITFCCVMISEKQKGWLAAWGCYLATLLPVIGIVQVGSQSMADRYAYLPSLAPFLVLAAGTSWGYEKVISRHRSRSMVMMLFIGAGIMISAGLSALTLRQVQVWKNGLSVWSYVIEKQPGKVSIAYTNLGSVYQKAGQFDKALEYYDKALSLDPNDYLAYVNRGVIFNDVGRYDLAIESYGRAVATNPADYTAYYNRGLTYDKIGRLNDAIEDFQKATKLQAKDPWTHNNLGILYSKAGRYDQSIAAFNNAIAIEPNNPVMFINRGLSFAFSGQYPRAIEDFSMAIHLDQKNVAAYFNRGDAYVKTGSIELAVSDFSKGCSLGDMNSCDALQEVSRLRGIGQRK
jgi:tetratricopeptide (TPR) repeat protein